MQKKAFYKSKTFQGLILMALSMAFPKFAGLINEVYPAVLDWIAQGAQLAGLIWAGVGRIKTDGAAIGLTDKVANPTGN